MIRLVKTVGVIIGYAAFSTTKIKKMKQLQAPIEHVQRRDEVMSLMAKKWADEVLDSAGVTVTTSGNNIKRDEAILFISNHEGNFDIPVLISAINQPFGFVSKIEVKQIPFLDKWMRLLNCVYLDRSSKRSSLQMIKDGVQSLKDGHSLMIFPEGSRSKGHGIGEFKAGSFKLSKSAKVKIVPIAIQGTSKIMEDFNSKKMKPGHVHVHLFEAIEPTIFEELSLNEVADQVKSQIEAYLHG